MTGDIGRDDRRLEPGRLSLDSVRAFWAGTLEPTLPHEAWQAVAASAAAVERILASHRTVYGVNTGFGLLAQTRISDDNLAQLQRNLVASHAVGVGAPLPGRVVRLAMLLKVISLARGLSGVRPVVIERLLALIAAEALPVVPAKGSVGASGDLAPLAYIAAALTGEGEIALDGERMPAGPALDRLDLAPLTLAPKEGLALLNGTQISTALALDALFAAERVFEAALLAGAMSTDAMKGSDQPFDPRIHAARGHPGQIGVARRLAELIAGSEIRASHADCDKVQDPYSLRCQPQVMGAVRDVMDQAADTLLREADAVTDNPLVFAEDDTAISGGNFHAEPVAFAADMLAMAISEIASLSERRVALLVDPKMSELPAFLVKSAGLNSGFMIAQVTAAALVAENRMLAHPASVDSIPTSAGQEDHVSMATHGARRLGEILSNTSRVVAIECLAAAQGLDFHAPMKTAPALAVLHRRIRGIAPHLEADRRIDGDIETIAGMIEAGGFAAAGSG